MNSYILFFIAGGIAFGGFMILLLEIMEIKEEFLADKYEFFKE